jgi:ethanolamine utilization microcompartment shell protein EutS
MMIDVIASDMPEFLDEVKSEDRQIFDYMSAMILMSKILSTDVTLSQQNIDSFSISFLDYFSGMLECSENIEKINKCYDYVTEFYMKLFQYLINAEEYEMCSNFKNFIDCFNEKNNSVDGLEE